MASFRFEREIIRRQGKAVAGVDEAGRGALFGPVVAAAVLFPPQLIQRPVRGWLKEVDDSKSLSPRQREKLAARILAEAETVGVGAASAQEVDRVNVYWASIEAMKRAVEKLTVRPDYLLIDGPGRIVTGFPCPRLCLPGGDRTSISIAAASIIAKVVRDELIKILGAYYQGYHLARNKGYGTKEHYQALKVKGPTPLHRLSFNLEGRSLE
ncbi:MAG: ribonuclease HII [Candidatus Aminicenantes bacterium]|nr:ribonuclease HII [Candidatus Aminicenantes bacterium]